MHLADSIPPVARVLFAVGAVAVLAGLVVWATAAWNLPLGRLPGDLRYERDGVRIYVPLATGLLVSVALSLVLWLVSRLRG